MEGDAAIRTRLRGLANERSLFGYRRLAILLKREGMRMNLKKVPPLSGTAARRPPARRARAGTRHKGAAATMEERR